MSTTETLPVAGTYGLDPMHSSAEFAVRHLGLAKVRGRIGVSSGTITIADDVEQSAVSVQLDAASFSTGNDDRDGHVKSPDFLDVEQFPTLSYRSTGVRRDGGAWIIDGELTVKDVTRSVPLRVDFEGSGTDPWGGSRIAFAAEAEIDREDFGITWNQKLETGGVLVGKQVKVSIDVQGVAS